MFIIEYCYVYIIKFQVIWIQPVDVILNIIKFSGDYPKIY